MYNILRVKELFVLLFIPRTTRVAMKCNTLTLNVMFTSDFKLSNYRRGHEYLFIATFALKIYASFFFFFVQLV